MDCGRCGAALQPGQRFCGRCGAATDAAGEPPTPLTTPLQVVEQTPIAPWSNGGTWGDTPPEGWHPDATPPLGVVVVGPPRVTALVVLAALTGALAVLATTSRLFTIEADGVQLQAVKANVFENVTVAALVGALALVGGAVSSSTGRRVGTGLAGGAGLAVTGLSATFVALALSSFDQAEQDAADEGTAVTLRFVTELGFWAFAAAGVLGLVVFAVSLRSSGPDGREPLDGLVATVGVLATAAAALGPMLPREGASIADNFTTDPSVWPTVAKCTSLGLVLLAGWVGFAGVRRWGVGLALGGISVGLWLWVTTLVQDDAFVMGIGVVNPGSFDFSPHPVTTVGVVGMVGAGAAMLAIDARSRTG